MPPFEINLLDHETEETGEVMTRDGEVIGTWHLLDGAIYSFTPSGGSEATIVDPFVPMFCEKIQAWHEAQAG